MFFWVVLFCLCFGFVGLGFFWFCGGFVVFWFGLVLCLACFLWKDISMKHHWFIILLGQLSDRSTIAVSTQISKLTSDRL